MNERIRDYQPSDRDPVVALSLRAWAPGFGSMEQVLGQEIFVRLHGEWAQYQARRCARSWPTTVYEKADYTLIPMARYFKAL
jgi:hypothetical protein